MRDIPRGQSSRAEDELERGSLGTFTDGSQAKAEALRALILHLPCLRFVFVGFAVLVSGALWAVIIVLARAVWAATIG